MLTDEFWGMFVCTASLVLIPWFRDFDVLLARLSSDLARLL
jgi:hypothetical protein